MEKRRSRQYPQSSPDGEQPDQPVGATVITQRSFEGYAQSRPFNETTLGELKPHVEAYRRRWPDDLVVVIVEMTRPEPTRSYRTAPGHVVGKLLADLRDELYQLTSRRFPKHIIDSLVNERIRQPYTPGEGGSVRGNAAWVLKYRGGNGFFHGDPEPDSEVPTDPLKETTWVAAWVGRGGVAPVKTRAGEEGSVPPPMAVIIISRHPRHASSGRNFYGERIAKQYRTPGTSYRWRCVGDQPLYLFMDMDRLFNNFTVNVATATLSINKYMEPNPSSRRHGVLPRVARLRNALVLSKFRKEFKTHEIAQKSMEKIAQYYVDKNTHAQRQNHFERFCDRLYDLGNELETVNLEVEMLREQCIYLMDSEFNTVAARTDARLGILTILAFVLTPAGFVVSLFSVIDAGTTQLIVSTVLVAFFSVVVYVVVDRLYRSLERKPLPSALSTSELDHSGIDGNEKLKRYR